MQERHLLHGEPPATYSANNGLSWHEGKNSLRPEVIDFGGLTDFSAVESEGLRSGKRMRSPAVRRAIVSTLWHGHPGVARHTAFVVFLTIFMGLLAERSKDRFGSRLE